MAQVNRSSALPRLFMGQAQDPGQNRTTSQTRFVETGNRGYLSLLNQQQRTFGETLSLLFSSAQLTTHTAPPDSLLDGLDQNKHLKVRSSCCEIVFEGVGAADRKVTTVDLVLSFQELLDYASGLPPASEVPASPLRTRLERILHGITVLHDHGLAGDDESKKEAWNAMDTLFAEVQTAYSQLPKVASRKSAHAASARLSPNPGPTPSHPPVVTQQPRPAGQPLSVQEPIGQPDDGERGPRRRAAAPEPVRPGALRLAAMRADTTMAAPALTPGQADRVASAIERAQKFADSNDGLKPYKAQELRDAIAGLFSGRDKNHLPHGRRLTDWSARFEKISTIIQNAASPLQPSQKLALNAFLLANYPDYAGVA